MDLEGFPVLQRRRRAWLAAAHCIVSSHPFRLGHLPALAYDGCMRQVAVTVVMAILFFAGIRLGVRWAESRHKDPLREESTVTVVQQIQSLSELVTVKYVVEKVVILEDQRWYGENRVLLLAHGVVKAGIDLRQLSGADVHISGNNISIRLPDAQITDAYLDDRQTRVIDHTTGMFREFDKDLEQTARKTAVADLRMAARQNGIINDANERARLELAVFFHQAGFRQIQFTGQKILPFEMPAIPLR